MIYIFWFIFLLPRHILVFNIKMKKKQAPYILEVPTRRLITA